MNTASEISRFDRLSSSGEYKPLLLLLVVVVVRVTSVARQHTLLGEWRRSNRL